jgi:hypothetical protein
LGFVSACDADRERHEQVQALLSAIEAVDPRMPAEKRAPQVQALRDLRLRDQRLDHTRDICVKVHEGLLTAEREQRLAIKALQAAAQRYPDGGLPPEQKAEITATIERSEQAHARALKGVPDCEQRSRELMLSK